jgi:putative ATP-binding cassette transporter
VSSRINRQTWIQFKSIAKPFFVSEMRWAALGMLVLLLGFALSVSGVNVFLSYVGRDFMTALSLRESDEFIRQLYRYLLVFACATPIVVFYRYTEERLALLWRRWLSRKMIDRYLSNGSYYRLFAFQGVDNPDQRIAEDIRAFTSQSISFLLIILNSFVALFSFTGILWEISPTLVLAVIGYAIFGSLSTYFLGRPLIGLNFAQLKKEADYRYKLINVRDNAESIAFYGNEEKEKTRSRQRLKIALSNLLQIVNWNRNLNFFTTGYNYLVSILPTVIVAPAYLNGDIEFGKITQAGFAFGQVLGALSIIVQNFGSLSSFGAVISRLGAFWEALDTIEDNKDLIGSQLILKEGDAITFQKVSVYTPKKDQVLLKDMTLELTPGQSLLITGTSGSGKSSMLRVMAGLWRSGQGIITAPPREQSMYLPQRPYMVLGTLRSQLLYTSKHKALSDEYLYEVLQTVRLEDMFHRLGGFDIVVDWPNILSTGEQQKLSFARLLISKPTYAFLDEATTALDQKTEEHLYKKLQSVVKSFVSVGYSTSLSKYHDVVLELTGGGNWRLECETGEL